MMMDNADEIHYEADSLFSCKSSHRMATLQAVSFSKQVI